MPARPPILPMPLQAKRTTVGSQVALRRLALASCLSFAGPLEAAPVTSLAIQRFQVTGNAALPLDQIQPVLQKATGPAVDLARLREALRELQQVYRNRGYLSAAFQVPRQLVTDGTLSLRIVEGPPLPAPGSTPAAAPPSASTPAPAPTPVPPAEPTFEVRHYEVLGNTVLPPEVIDRTFTNAIGPVVGFTQVQSALGTLQLAYRERGYATVSVALPQQQLTNATVKVQVTEGVLTDIRVTGNRYFGSNNVVRALPSLQTNTLLNSRVFQRELDVANQNRDRQIYPTIGPGPEPGTSALTLRVQDRLPLHGRVEINNHSTPGTPEWRINSSVQFNNLWQREHQMGVSYGFSPEEYKTDGLFHDYLLNRPLIANLGAYYRLPLGEAESVARRLASSSGFGYDEATHQFRLPPAGARPDLSFFASTASSDTGVQFGPARVVSQTPLLTIVSQDSGQNLSVDRSAGTRFNLPIPVTDSRRFALSAGPDWKSYSLQSFNTNNFIITTVVTNAQGSQTIESRVSSPQPTRHHEVQYVPLVLAGDFSSTDTTGSVNANLSLSANFVGDSADFASLAYSSRADATFGRASTSLTREQRLPRDWSLLLRAAGQAATGPLISNEQFAVGGLNSVRGYFEGDQYGDAGWFGSLEVRTPFLLSRVPTGSDWAPVWLRASAFIDAGQRLLMDEHAASEPLLTLLGTGFGLSANINNRVDLRIVVGWPLFETRNSPAGESHAYFSLGGQF